MENRKSQFTDVTWRVAILTRRDWDKYSEWGGMAGLSQEQKQKLLFAMS